MFDILQVVTVLLVAVAMALTLAHALELPGKMRLTKDVYYAMQHIYYPGFTNDYPVVLCAVGERRFLADACSTTGTHRYAGDLLAVYAPGEQVLAAGAKIERPWLRLFLVWGGSFSVSEERPCCGLDGVTQSMGIFTRRARMPRIRQSNHTRYRHLEWPLATSCLSHHETRPLINRLSF